MVANPRQVAEPENKVRARVNALIAGYVREISECAEDEEYPSLINREMLTILFSAAHNAPPRRKFERFEASARIREGQIKEWLEKAGDPRYAACALFSELFLKIRSKKDDNLDAIVIDKAYEDPIFALQVQKQYDPHAYGTTVIEKHDIKEAIITVKTLNEIRLQIGQNIEQLREIGFHPDGSPITASEALGFNREILQCAEGEPSPDVSAVEEAVIVP